MNVCERPPDLEHSERLKVIRGCAIISNVRKLWRMSKQRIEEATFAFLRVLRNETEPNSSLIPDETSVTARPAKEKAPSPPVALWPSPKILRFRMSCSRAVFIALSSGSRLHVRAGTRAILAPAVVAFVSHMLLLIKVSQRVRHIVR